MMMEWTGVVDDDEVFGGGEWLVMMMMMEVEEYRSGLMVIDLWVMVMVVIGVHV